jgi:hypothetical protein
MDSFHPYPFSTIVGNNNPGPSTRKGLAEPISWLQLAHFLFLFERSGQSPGRLLVVPNEMPTDLSRRMAPSSMPIHFALPSSSKLGPFARFSPQLRNPLTAPLNEWFLLQVPELFCILG